ncbi:unnamed protein product [Effrenium voratum]|nr:unnamed protein product [Effrenium voratum]
MRQNTSTETSLRATSKRACCPCTLPSHASRHEKSTCSTRSWRPARRCTSACCSRRATSTCVAPRGRCQRISTRP